MCKSSFLSNVFCKNMGKHVAFLFVLERLLINKGLILTGAGPHYATPHNWELGIYTWLIVNWKTFLCVALFPTCYVCLF